MLDIALIKQIKTCLGSSIPYSSHLYDLLMVPCKWPMGSLCVGHNRWHYLSLPISPLLLLGTLLLWYWYCSSVSFCQMEKGSQMGILLQSQKCFYESTGIVFLTWLCTFNFIIRWSKTCRPWTVCAIVTAPKFVQHGYNVVMFGRFTNIQFNVCTAAASSLVVWEREVGWTISYIAEKLTTGHIFLYKYLRPVTFQGWLQTVVVQFTDWSQQLGGSVSKRGPSPLEHFESLTLVSQHFLLLSWGNGASSGQSSRKHVIHVAGWTSIPITSLSVCLCSPLDC